MKKRVSVKMFFAVLWRGVCQVFHAIGRLFGIKDGCSYTRTVWRLATGVIATLVLIVSVALLWTFLDEVVYREWIRPYTSERVYRCKNLSSRIEFQRLYYQESGRVYDNVEKKVLLEDVDWVSTSSDNDSLAVFAWKEKRGYLNRFTGEVVIPAIYTRAWVFCEGIAAVEKDGELLFIDHVGRVVIDKDFTVMGEDPIYAFLNGYCEVKNSLDGKTGLIDRQGNWVLLPEYDWVWYCNGLWKVRKDDSFGLFSAEMDTIFSTDKVEIAVMEDVIEVRYKNHTAKQFDYEGNVLVDFVIDDISTMRYETLELRPYESGDGLEEYMKHAVADCQMYMVRCGNTDYYGLMDRNGRRITPPDYEWIEAVAKDLYLCQPQGVLINNQGKRVE